MNAYEFRSSLVLLLLLLSLPASAANYHVVVAPNGDLLFDPKTLTINIGDTVTWQFAGDPIMPHNVMSPGLFRCAVGCDGEGGNGNPTKGAFTVTRTFSDPGTINYRGEIHFPVMVGTITVNSGEGVFDLNRQGLTGSWFQMATAGQGVEVEVYPDMISRGTGFIQAAWFTYDYYRPPGPPEASRQLWYTFSGNVQTGQSSATLTLYANYDGNFNAPPVTNAKPVGSVVLSAADCNHITMAYQFNGSSVLSGTIPMTRLLPNVTCTSSGPEPPNADFGYSGNWYDMTTSGQGIVFELNPNQPLAWLTWHTYAPPNGRAEDEVGQRWYTGQAAYTPGARVIPMTLYQTIGGLFDKPAPIPTTVAVGTATVTFTSCAALKLDFTFTGGSSAGASGTINMTRVGPTPAGCPVVGGAAATKDAADSDGQSQMD